MKLRTRLLRIVSGDCGPASKNVLRGIARAHGYPSDHEFNRALRELLDAGELVMRGKRKGAVYGPPKRAR